jgi:F-type H+-transporting ATPase subunit a
MAVEAEPDVWTTVLFNKYLAEPADTVLNWIGLPPENPAHPWENWMTMEVLVVAIIIVAFWMLRRSLSVERPGKVQHLAELMYGFFVGQTGEAVGHGAEKYTPFFGTLFIFILFLNLIGIVPGFESPTMNPVVPAGFAVTAFIYYNYMGVREHGLGRYLAHFMGPFPLLAPLMIPLEIISHLARMLSLTMRLYANMFAGEKVTLVFLTLTYIMIPAVFQGLHVFVSFLQAYIFMALTMLYVGAAVAHEEH